MLTERVRWPRANDSFRPALPSYDPAASGWLLSLNMPSLNNCCDQEQTLSDIHGPFTQAG